MRCLVQRVPNAERGRRSPSFSIGSATSSPRPPSGLSAGGSRRRAGRAGCGLVSIPDGAPSKRLSGKKGRPSAAEGHPRPFHPSGDRLTSDVGVLVLAEIERKLGVADRPTRSHPELGRENPPRQWYCVSKTWESRSPPGPPTTLHNRLEPPVPSCHAGHTVPHMPIQHPDAGWSSPVARQAHNLKVAGSNPAPATKSIKGLPAIGGSCLCSPGSTWVAGAEDIADPPRWPFWSNTGRRQRYHAAHSPAAAPRSIPSGARGTWGQRGRSVALR